MANRHLFSNALPRCDDCKFYPSAYESKLDAKEVVDDFEARGFSEFLSHPLLLALACILKTSRARVSVGECN